MWLYTRGMQVQSDINKILHAGFASTSAPALFSPSYSGSYFQPMMKRHLSVFRRFMEIFSYNHSLG
jgi:hypothetical protein